MPFRSREDAPEAGPGEPEQPGCSFCNRRRPEVRKLIAGPSVFICDECVQICVEIINESEVIAPKAWSKPDAQSLADWIGAGLVGHAVARRRLAGVIRRHLHGGLAGDGGPVVLLVGPSGSGKTALCRALCREGLPIPAHHAHVNRVLATGLVRDDIEDLLFELLESARSKEGENDPSLVEFAARGLLVLEDLQHIASRQSPEGGVSRNVVGTEAQRQVVRLLDGLPVRIPNSWGVRNRQDPKNDFFHTAGLQFVLTCRVDDPPENERALRATLEDLGLLPELLARVRLLVRLPRPDAALLRKILTRRLLPDAAALVADLGGTLAVNADLVEAIVQDAARHRDAAWRLKQRVAQLVDQAL